MPTVTDWDRRAIASQYETAAAAQALLQAGNTAEASRALQALVDAMGRSEKQAVKSQLVRLMLHVIKWQTQPHKRSRSWVLSILDARDAIADSQAEMPRLNRTFLLSLWEECLGRALRNAEVEMGQPPAVTTLGWDEVFEAEYRVESSTDTESELRANL